LGRNHAGRPRHRLVRTEGAGFGLADADAGEPDATSALADERLIVQRRRSQDDTASRKHKRSEDHREAHDGAAQDDREARHRKADDREARHGKARDGEAWRPQDGGSAPDHGPFHGEAHDPSQLDPQEAQLEQARN
jgi:hypothetical protein